MKKSLPVVLFLIVISVVFAWVVFQDTSNPVIQSDDFEEEEEGRPAQPVLEGDEKERFMDFVLNRPQTSSKSASRVASEKSTYANGRLTGSWNYKLSQSGWYGYRVDNSAYDSVKNVFYVVTYAGHLYKLEYDPTVKWTLLNHKVVMNPPSNADPNPVFFGVHLPNATYRLIRSNDDTGQMEYSDDEGKSWVVSTGAILSRSPSNQGFLVKQGEGLRIVLHTYRSGYHHLYFSDDHGETYQKSPLTFPISNLDMRIVKSFYSDNAYMYVWSKSDKTMDTYKYSEEEQDFEILYESDSQLDGTNLSSVGVTYSDGTFHSYVSTVVSGNYTVYYSDDEGATWVSKHSGRDRAFETISPDQPGTLFSGFEDMRMSQNHGATWVGFGHKLGWDLQHMSAYETKDGGSITLAGLDFGCYVSRTPEDKESYIWCNNGAPYAMHYDVASSQNFNSIYMANQDRGATAYYDSGEKVGTKDIDGTDVLRVTYAKRETSVWSWFYYGRIRRRSNFAVGNERTAVYDGLGNWWAAPIVASPDPNEDAIYAAYGSNLQKFSYNTVNNSIAKTEHPFNFETQYGSTIGGFGYSPLDAEKWYVALNNGTFLYSADGGESWTKSSYTGTKPTSQGGWIKNQIVIRTSEIESDKVYYAGVGNQMLVSDDGGANFTNKNIGFDVSRVRDFALSPDEKFIFAACGYGGAWVYSEDEGRWFQMEDDPIPSVDFTDVEFIKRKNLVRFGSFGSGIIELTLDSSFYSLMAPDDLNTSIKHTNHIVLSWTHDGGSEKGFYVERAPKGGDFEFIDTLQADRTGYEDSNAAYGQTYFYRVTAFDQAGLSFSSNLSLIDLPKAGYINKSQWSVIKYSGQGSSNIARYAIDNDVNSSWRTPQSGDDSGYPHYIEIDLKESYALQGFSVLPESTGTIDEYEFFVSDDPDNWGDPVISGQFGAGIDEQQATFSDPRKGRYVRLNILSAGNDSGYSGLKEFDLLFYDQVPPSPLNLTATVYNDTSIEITWKDNSDYEIGYILEQITKGDFFKGDAVFEEVAVLADSMTSFRFDNMPLDSTYGFRVRAYNLAGLSPKGNVVFATLESPSLLAAKHRDRLNVYPNPTTSIVTIDIPENMQPFDLRLMSVSGQVVLKRSVKTESRSVNISLEDLPSGIYLLEVIDLSSGETVQQRIRKQ